MSDKTMQEKYKKNLESYIDIKHTPPCDYTLFCDGYAIAQKEMEEKLDAAIEVIKFYANRDNWHPWQQGLEVLIDGEDAEGIMLNEEEGFDLGGKRARDFLKARGE